MVLVLSTATCLPPAATRTLSKLEIPSIVQTEVPNLLPEPEPETEMNLRYCFRRLDAPIPDDWLPGVHWLVEAYPTDHDSSHPVGQCWVSDPSIRRPADWKGEDYPPTVDFILVEDRYRRQGVATA